MSRKKKDTGSKKVQKQTAASAANKKQASTKKVKAKSSETKVKTKTKAAKAKSVGTKAKKKTTTKSSATHTAKPNKETNKKTIKKQVANNKTIKKQSSNKKTVKKQTGSKQPIKKAAVAKSVKEKSTVPKVVSKVSNNTPTLHTSPLSAPHSMYTPPASAYAQATQDAFNRMLDKWGNSSIAALAEQLLLSLPKKELSSSVIALTKKEETALVKKIHNLQFVTPEDVIKYVLENIEEFKHKSIATTLLKDVLAVSYFVNDSKLSVTGSPSNMYKYATKNTVLGFYWDASTHRFEYIASYARQKQILPCVLLFGLTGSKVMRKLGIEVYI